jgi:hypothetical protein
VRPPRRRTRAPRARGDSFIRLIAGLFFAAFILYCGLNVYHSLENPFRTELAAPVTVSDTASARGFVVREEEVIPGVSGGTIPRLGDGEKASRGQLVADAYGAGANFESAARLGELRSRIKRLGEAAAATPEARARESETAVTELAYLISRRELAAAREKAVVAESLIMGAQDSISAAAELAALEAELNALEATLSGGTPVYAPKAGLYAQSADGFEGIAPDRLSGLAPDALEALFAFPSGEPGAGRLITGTRWYLALIVDSESASALLELESVTVRLTTPIRAEFSMRVENVGKNDGARRVVTLSCAYGMADILTLRAAEAEIVYRETSGLRVPREALRLEPASAESEALETFVYIAEGHRAKRVRTDILRESGGMYIIKANASAGLRGGCEIIVKANGLYDGKVIR